MKLRIVVAALAVVMAASAAAYPDSGQQQWNKQMCGSNSWERIKTPVTEFAVSDSTGTCVNATEFKTRFAVGRVIRDISWQYPNIASGYVPEGEPTCASWRDTCFHYPVQQRYDGHPVISFSSWLTPGTYNESVDTWFSPVKSRHSVQTRAGDTEIMIWTAYPGIDDRSHFVAYATIDGMRFGIMSWEAWNSWRYVAYLWLNAPHVGSGRFLTVRGLALNPFFANAEQHGWLHSSEYLWAVDLGFELVRGGLHNNIHDYSLTGVK